MAQPLESGVDLSIYAVTPIDQERIEEERYTLLPLREIDLRIRRDQGEEGERAARDLSAFYQMPTAPENIHHFANPPLNPNDLRRKLLRDGTHAYVAENLLGEVVGAGGINDAEPGQHDHFLVKVVTHPARQGKKLGTKIVIKLTDTALNTKTTDGRQREKLDLAIIEGPPGWERMERIAEELGYQFRSRLPRQVDVGGVRFPTVRYEILGEDWEFRRPLLAVKYNMPVDLPQAA